MVVVNEFVTGIGEGKTDHFCSGDGAELGALAAAYDDDGARPHAA